MSDDSATKIAELQATLAIPGLPAAARELVEQQLRAFQAAQSVAATIDSPHADRDINIATNQTVSTPTGTVANQGHMHGNAIGVNYGSVQAFFGGASGEKGEQLLADYLTALEHDCQRLHLARLTGRRQTGADQRATPDRRAAQSEGTCQSEACVSVVAAPSPPSAARGA